MAEEATVPARPPGNRKHRRRAPGATSVALSAVPTAFGCALRNPRRSAHLACWDRKLLGLGLTT
eukprot:14608180-Alexandrium_andersonii.AAC.1